MKILSNERNVMIMEADNKIVLISYRTCVACIDQHTGKKLNTSTRWSVTTSRHINSFFNAYGIGLSEVDQREQGFFDTLLDT